MSHIPSPHMVESFGNGQRSFFEDDNEGFIIVNGRRIRYGNGISGRKIMEMAGNDRGRRVVKVSGGCVKKIEPQHYYTPEELIDKHGRSVKITTMPERTKGGLFDFLSSVLGQAPQESAPSQLGIFGGQRSEISRQIITEQVIDLAENYFKHPVVFDEKTADYVIFPKFRLPRNWSQPTTPLLIMFPRDYPVLPPIGFYLPDTLPSPHGHKYSEAYHSASSAPLQEGWHWYCCYVEDGSWRPAPLHAPKSQRKGDNLWTYLTLINEVLASND